MPRLPEADAAIARISALADAPAFAAALAAEPHVQAGPVETLVPVLGDQLSLNLPSLAAADRERSVVLMAEVMREASYVGHHKQKIAFIFSAMRHFAIALRKAGWRVDYITLENPDNTGSLAGEVQRAAARHGCGRVLATKPGEWRVLEDMSGWGALTGCEAVLLEDTRFLCPLDEFAAWAEGRKQLRMEYFYREMRRKTGLLMEGDEPAGGRWNFDAENRKPAEGSLFLPRPFRAVPDAVTKEVLALVGDRFAQNFGRLEGFAYGVTAQDAQAALEWFLREALLCFGDYQDAMLKGEAWLYHSVLSPYLNTGLLDPLEVCRRVEAEWRAGRVPLNSAEGYIRQIIGWREYVRGLYWLKMPGYTEENALAAHRPLPAFYWTGETDMLCLREAITQTRDTAYAHHIQRLMVTGNFAMLAGINPREVHEWYLAVYIDAFEWVEAPNTIGMSQFADGGLLGSKPYAAGGNYINRMSDYCGSCRYDVKQRTGRDACPLNALYWDFLVRNGEKLRGNPRLAQVFRTYGKMAEEAKRDLHRQASAFLKAL